jgi:thiamine biosynthesis lipoprotein
VSTIRSFFHGVILLFVQVFSTPCAGQHLLREKANLMGSSFEITLTGSDSLRITECVREVVSEIERIENLISEWRPHTQISEVNRNAGVRPVKVDAEVFDLTRRAIRYSEWSNGAFDITVAGIDHIWRFDDSMTELPTPDAIRRSIQHVGYQNVVLDSIASTIFLRLPGMKIGFGSIGKGYAADRGRALLEALGVQGGIVNASGDLSCWGHPPGKRHWKIGITHPFKRAKIVKMLKVNRGSVATSGNYQKYAEINGVRYSHIINPQSGYPSVGLSSVTVVGPSAELANALSTSLMVLGRLDGRRLRKMFPKYSMLMITEEGRVFRR